MLQIHGKCLGVSTETVNPGPNQFTVQEIAVLSGEGADSEVNKVRVGRDFPHSEIPDAGEDCSLNVVISAFASRAGAGYRLTALSRAYARPVAAAS